MIFVQKFVGMEGKLLKHVMMEIQKMVMVARINVPLKMVGVVKVELNSLPMFVHPSLA